VHHEIFHCSDEGVDDELSVGVGDRAAIDCLPEVVRIPAVCPVVELGALP
jgi:hypothetical protein